MKRRKNVGGSNNANTNKKTKQASSNADQYTVTTNKKNKVKKKAAVDIFVIEDSNKERKARNVGEASLISSSPSLSITGETTYHTTINSTSSLEGWVENWDWPREGLVVDEQMSWGSTWSPTWDVEYMGEACVEMFNDVMWDDDIWNLKSVDKVPNS